MLHNPNEAKLFPVLSPEKINHLKEYGTEIPFKSGDVLFHEGETDYPFLIVLEGKVRMWRRVGPGEQTLIYHKVGHFLGEISILSGGKSIASAQAVYDGRVLRIEAETFRQIMAVCSPLAELVLSAMVERTRDVEAQTRQQEKLAALGKMSAGLAHELNNPASAARQAARNLHTAIEQAQMQAIQRDERFVGAQREVLKKLGTEILEGRFAVPNLPTLERSDREDELTNWLEDQNIEDGWDYAPPLVSTGVDIPTLATLAAAVGQERLDAALAWLTTTLNLVSMTDDIDQSTSRVSDIVAAMKEYSYMDRAAYQEVDINHSLDSTLAIFNHKLRRGIEVVREYDTTLPKILGYGSEINQVWTNLIDNAIDAMRGQGRLIIRTAREYDKVRVEITDDGPGIPGALQDRIWEPFFTTKGVGEGTGLGLDIVRRIVIHRHGGQVRMHSIPGDTCFEVLLPMNAVVDQTPIIQPAELDSVAM
ncbi:MAG: cyclic nucleotide-binding domain-containing protein [Chloroflexaceae bacterium]|nr:cyclic nucleotide-binding domain-containing protein [Chloroflexaceae bacterium]